MKAICLTISFLILSNLSCAVLTFTTLPQLSSQTEEFPVQKKGFIFNTFHFGPYRTTSFSPSASSIDSTPTRVELKRRFSFTITDTLSHKSTSVSCDDHALRTYNTSWGTTRLDQEEHSYTVDVGTVLHLKMLHEPRPVGSSIPIYQNGQFNNPDSLKSYTAKMGTSNLRIDSYSTWNREAHTLFQGDLIYLNDTLVGGATAHTQNNRIWISANRDDQTRLTIGALACALLFRPAL